ncbi:MAG: hypothetical protein M3R63_06950 [Actinomycetota bacterium]|nr:hypothetical protein [Actinomycetota bacterium]
MWCDTQRASSSPDAAAARNRTNPRVGAPIHPCSHGARSVPGHLGQQHGRGWARQVSTGTCSVRTLGRVGSRDVSTVCLALAVGEAHVLARVPIDLVATAHRFRAGHHVRLQVSSGAPPPPRPQPRHRRPAGDLHRAAPCRSGNLPLPVPDPRHIALHVT